MRADLHRQGEPERIWKVRGGTDEEVTHGVIYRCGSSSKSCSHFFEILMIIYDIIIFRMCFSVVHPTNHRFFPKFGATLVPRFVTRTRRCRDGGLFLVPWRPGRALRIVQKRTGTTGTGSWCYGAAQRGWEMDIFPISMGVSVKWEVPNSWMVYKIYKGNIMLKWMISGCLLK